MANRGEPLLMVHAVDRIPDRTVTEEDKDFVRELAESYALDDDDKAQLLDALGLADGQA